ncbi:nucleic acid/nucleotide deaminase domain-containing protein [Streptomyces sp. NPDC051740]|uniref:nucleic acid/nucleotide deaminase domain-containing protein n=1 Tax=Streptomyces sp. NPDC051740 TaxID=3365673 RepID=UPI003796A625
MGSTHGGCGTSRVTTRTGPDTFRTALPGTAAGTVHSEAHADEFLDSLGIDPARVTAIYSERNFCTTAGHDCAARMSRFTNASLSWSFERGDNALSAIRRKVFGG